MGVRTTDKSDKGFGQNKVLDQKSLNFRRTSRTGGGTNPPPPEGYQIQRSLRFNSSDSAYLSRTPASAGNRKTWTWAAWVKRSALGANQALFEASPGGSSYTLIWFNSSDKLGIAEDQGGGGLYFPYTAAVFRDTSAWYHIVVAVDTTQATSTNRIKIYVNGVQQTIDNSYPSQNLNTYVNFTNAHRIGYRVGNSAALSGYLADVHFIDGQALDPTRFTQVSATTGQLIPKAYTGTFTGNSFWLPFSDNSAATATTLGKDGFLLGNNWSCNNLSVTNSYPVITQAKIYSVFNGGSRGADYTVQYSDDNTNWTTAFTGNMSTSGCGLVTGSGTGNGSYGGHRYWRYVIGTATIIHHPNAARYVLSDGSTDYNLYVHTADNCSDIGTWGGSGTTYSGQLPLSTLDSLVDTPTSYGVDAGNGGEVRGNYATLNPLSPVSGFTLANGNLDVSFTSYDRVIVGTFGMTSGKWYWEYTQGFSGANQTYGILSASAALSGFGGGTGGYCVIPVLSRFYANGSFSTYGSSLAIGDILGVAFDADAGVLTFYKNGTALGTASSSVPAGTYLPSVGNSGPGTNTATANFGQRPFAYTAPSGYKALCTTNLPDPVVAQPSTVMDVALWTGNGGNQSITLPGGFNPDLVWVKSRSNAQDHYLFDAVRGGASILRSNTTGAESTGTTYLSFDTSGFSSLNGLSSNGYTYAGWCFDAGSSTVTNTQGSITSTVRANPSAGFSIVTYTGNGVNGASIGHGLGVAPHMVISKSRSNSNTSWGVFHKSLGAGKNIWLDLTNAASTSNTWWYGVDPTSTVTYVGSGSNETNQNGWTFVHYCFAPVAGYSSMSSFVGNGSSDGVFVYTGFRPRYFFIKRSDSTGDWRVYDTARSPYNTAGNDLLFNSSQADADLWPFDILSNGFKIRSSDVRVNASGGTYIYAAFAESPFKTSRAR